MKNKPLLYAVVGLVALVAIVLAATSQKVAAPPQAAPESAPAAPVYRQSQQPAGVPPSAPSAQTIVTPLSIKVLLPVQDEQWVIGESHTIRWSKEAEIPGGRLHC